MFTLKFNSKWIKQAGKTRKYFFFQQKRKNCGGLPHPKSLISFGATKFSKGGF
jgi:hypothetical protein